MFKRENGRTKMCRPLIYFKQLLLIIAFVVVVVVPNEQSVLRIMPLGDSITQGAGIHGGYRKPLHETLSQHNYTIEFVGTKDSNSFSSFDHHEGHGGWNIANISSHIAGFLDQIEDPDIILLHIGVNDFGPKGHDREHAINRLSKLLTKISKLQPHSHIMTTNLMYRHGYWTDIQRFFNVFVEDLVHEHVRKGENIQYVDLQTIQYPADFQDRVHPNAVGFQKMGEAWADVIMNTIGPYSELCLDENKPRFIDVDLDDKQKGCKWLRNRKDKARIDNICSSNDDAKQHCKVTCGTCPISMGPSVVGNEPSPGSCFDENKPRFIDVDLDDNQKGCKWLRKKNDKATIDNICSSNDDAKQHCKVTCGTCPISMGPSVVGNEPSPGSCFDEDKPRFIDVAAPKQKGCKWLLKKNDKATIDNICSSNDDAKQHCKVTCGTCPISMGPSVVGNEVSPGSCFDENKARFIDVDLDNKQKSCKWLRNRKDKATIDNICSSNDDAKQHCKVTCRSC